MADAIVIGPELPFRGQAVEVLQHLFKSLPNNTDQAVARDFLAQFDAQLKSDDPSQSDSSDKRRSALAWLVAKLVELGGGLEGAKDADAEACHLLLQHLLASTYEPESQEYTSSVKQITEVVKKAGEEAYDSDRIVKFEIAARVLNNTYSYLPPSSPLRPFTLLSLIQLLAHSSDLSHLAISPASLTSSLSQWSVSDADKLAFVTSAAGTYASAGEAAKALELALVAIQQLSAGADVVEKAVVYAIADKKRFAIDDVLRAQGIQGNVSGQAASLVSLFTGDAIKAVSEAQQLVSSNGSWIESFSASSFP